MYKTLFFYRIVILVFSLYISVLILSSLEGEWIKYATKLLASMESAPLMESALMEAARHLNLSRYSVPCVHQIYQQTGAYIEGDVDVM